MERTAAAPGSPERPLTLIERRRLIRVIDLTALAPDTTEGDIRRLAEIAHTSLGDVAAIVVRPEFVRTARRFLDAGGPIRVATVVDFPYGTGDPPALGRAAEHAALDGADEIDLVWCPIPEISGDYERNLARHRAVAAVGLPIKAIIETAAYRADERLLAEVAVRAAEAGAAFLKTSTGVGPGATFESVRLLARVAAHYGIGVKPSGGIRTAAAAYAMARIAGEHVDAGDPARLRIGTSVALDAIVAGADDETGELA